MGELSGGGGEGTEHPQEAAGQEPELGEHTVCVRWRPAHLSGSPVLWSLEPPSLRRAGAWCSGR